MSRLSTLRDTQRRRPCFECDSPEHSAGQCPTAAVDARRLGVDGPQPSAPKRAYSCRVCGETGHTSRRCARRDFRSVLIPGEVLALVEAEAVRVAERTGKPITINELAAELLRASVG